MRDGRRRARCIGFNPTYLCFKPCGVRGRGLGTRLWLARRDLLRARLAPDAAIGMDGVEAMVPFYARGGFVFSHQNRRFCFPGRTRALSPAVVPAARVDFAALVAFDRDSKVGAEAAMMTGQRAIAAFCTISTETREVSTMAPPLALVPDRASAPISLSRAL